jgi:DNA-binding response OmpR family regulator
MKKHRLRVLFADGDFKHRREAARRIESAGWSVIPAATGADVLIQCEVEVPHVIVLDVSLPDMEGYDVCSQLRRLPEFAETPIIFTAETRDEMTFSYLSQMVEFSGGDYFLAKPYDLQVLDKLLATLLPEYTENTPASPPVYPTRVAWPTTRTASTFSMPF